jgi:branched-chain amino acid transport system permease protein
MDLFLQYLVNGLSLGSVFALLAVGLTLIFGGAGIGNFAHGDFFTFGAFGLYVLFSQMKLPLISAGVGSILFVVFISLASYFLVYNPLLKRRGPLTLFVASMGLSITLTSLALVIWGPTPQTIVSSHIRVNIGEVTISMQRVFAILGAFVCFGILYWFLRFTKIGKEIRAVSQNREAATVVGIDVNKVFVTTFAISGALAGMAAFFVAPIYTIFPSMGLMLALKAFAIVIMGGLGSVPGAIIGAFILGIVESMTAGYIATEIQDILPFATMIVVLLIRPQGLFKGTRIL